MMKKQQAIRKQRKDLKVLDKPKSSSAKGKDDIPNSAGKTKNSK